MKTAYNKKFTTDVKSIDDIIEMIHVSRTLGLPNFQRPVVWDNNKKLELLIAVIVGDPVGSLLWVTPGDDAADYNPDSVERAPDLEIEQQLSLIVDGQQRITALYQTLSGLLYKKRDSKRTWAVEIDVKRALSDDLLHVQHLGMTFSNPPSVQEQAEAGIMRASVLVDGIELSDWQSAFAKAHYGDDKEKMREEVGRLGPGLIKGVGSFVIPVITLDETNALGDVLEYFERLNTRGMPLNSFDISHARVSHSGSGKTKAYDLRSQVSDAIEKSKWLKRLGIGTDSSDDLMLPLQSLALRIAKPHFAFGTTAEYARVKDVSNSSILSIPPKAVVGVASKDVNVLQAVKMLDKAAEFLIQQCGVGCARLLPQKSILLPVADQKWSEQLGLGCVDNLKLKRWYYSLCLQGEFHGRTKSAAILHTRKLHEWAITGTEPEVIKATTRRFVLNEVHLDTEYSHMAKIQGAAVLAMVAVAGAKDWSTTGKKVLDLADVDLHHMVPESFLKKTLKLRSGSLQNIANFTPIAAETNRSIKDNSVKDVFSGWSDADRDAVISGHVLDYKLLSTVKAITSYEKFLVDRERRLKEFVIKELGLS